MDLTNFLSFWFAVVYSREISINAQATLSNFSIGNSFTCMDPTSSSNATYECKGGAFCEYPDNEEA